MLKGLFKTEDKKAFDIHAILCHSIIVLLRFSVKRYYIYGWYCIYKDLLHFRLVLHLT